LERPGDDGVTDGDAVDEAPAGQKETTTHN